ncbi:hypothetical protein BEN47_16785 [Hymenobacter lapidarius]|uniref:HTH cro/C1-type domain-containing protein n=1 Tax=Hymenobacter lapidarius TaxID=1908237 RepID=A0A1G1SZS3_9BACT|nr:helix-turn-helix transcriptional regulator [Hymenobacter lapidarius]OGX84133.1 hypothetical protein BEN47_16785 [Hymenobacter lapidarius]
MNPTPTPKHPGIAARLEAFIAEKADNPRQFALSAGLTPQVISHLLQGKAVPSGDTLTALVTKWPGLNTTWLLTGKGAMYLGDSAAQLPPALPDPIREGFPPVPGTATPQQADFVGRYLTQLEAENARLAGMVEWLQHQNEVLLGKSPASADAAVYTMPLPPVSQIGFQIAARAEPCVVRQMWEAEHAEPLRMVS